jgi:hypothetical protein
MRSSKIVRGSATPRARSETSSSAASLRRRARRYGRQSRVIAKDGTLRNFVLNEPRGCVLLAG